MAHLLIVGAGASGLYAATIALELGHKVTLLEHMNMAGKKLLITGKGRCNITNDCEEEEYLKNIRRNPKFLYSCIANCPPSFIINQFEKWGVATKVERGRRVFPQSDKSQDVLNALLKNTEQATYICAQAEKLLLNENNTVIGVATNKGEKLYADAVLVATGGVSYPDTGSTGIGYTLAKQVGHKIVTPVPSLVALVEQGDIAKKMMGLSLKNVQLTLWENKKKKYTDMGEMIFTHFGISGPLVLSASAYIGDIKKKNYFVTIDLKPALTADQLDNRIQRDFLDMANKSVGSSLDKLLPNKMRSVMLSLWQVDLNKKINQVTKQERIRLVELIKAFPIYIKDRGDFAHAVITSGGVDVREVDPKTMQSKKADKLFFAGEVLNVDGYTGGYNLQIAWATAYAAAHGFAST